VNDRIGVPASALAQSVQKHNASLPTRNGDRRTPVLRGPFYALGPVLSWIVFTEGGLAVTPRHEVVTREGAPIPGLFAVGSAGQGGTILAGHGHHIGWAMTSGRRAGRFAAELATAA